MVQWLSFSSDAALPDSIAAAEITAQYVNNVKKFIFVTFLLVDVFFEMLLINYYAASIGIYTKYYVHYVNTA